MWSGGEGKGGEVVGQEVQNDAVQVLVGRGDGHRRRPSTSLKAGLKQEGRQQSSGLAVMRVHPLAKVDWAAISGTEKRGIDTDSGK